MTTSDRGPLAGIRVLEFASLAPAPFACTLLSDLGADVLRVTNPADRGLTAAPHPGDPLDRGRTIVALDLKQPEGRRAALDLTERADVLVEGLRPGVMERLGLGPEPCLERNLRLIYARMTGWGQYGPLAARAGHDINYLALAGALEPLGPFEPPGASPTPPLNYVADFGGGGMLLAVGVLAALVERERSGRGQVVDAAMTDGAALITGILHGLRARGLWHEERGGNLFDGSAPFYATYTCSDGRFVAVGAVEPQFYAELIDKLGLAGQINLTDQYERATWPDTKQRLAETFVARTRDEWDDLFAESDACVTPVLTPWEAPRHPHNAARGTFTDIDGHIQPAPAPRFSRTPAANPPSPPRTIDTVDDHPPFRPPTAETGDDRPPSSPRTIEAVDDYPSFRPPTAETGDDRPPSPPRTIETIDDHLPFQPPTAETGDDRPLSSPSTVQAVDDYR